MPPPSSPHQEKRSAHHDEQRPYVPPEKVDAHPAAETSQLLSQAGVAKAELPWADLIVKSILGGMFISLGAAFDIAIAGGSAGLRASNPAIVTMLSGFVFPIGFVLIVITNTELCTSNMAVMAYSTLQRRTSLYDLVKVWVVSYVGNFVGCLFFAGVLVWWSDAMETASQSDWAVSQAEARVNVNWAYNFTRGIGCNWLVGLAIFLATSGKDNLSKIVGIWLPVWAFVGLGYQHSIANFFLVPIGMFYGTSFGVGVFIYRSVIPVTLGNIVGGAGLVGAVFWFLYGRNDTVRAIDRKFLGQKSNATGGAGAGVAESDSERTVGPGEDGMQGARRRRSGTEMV